MDTAVFQQPFGSLQSHHFLNNSNICLKFRSCLIKLTSESFKVENGLSRKKSNSSEQRSFTVIQASASQTSLVDPVSSPLRNSIGESQKKSSEAALILIRHGESLWNEKNLFTGCVDVPLTNKGVEEAIEAGNRIYTSVLIPAQMTAMLAMTQHRRRKVPVILHNESQQARNWSRIFSDDTIKQTVPVITAWQLNESGLNKQETADRFGKEKVHEWHRSYDIPPSNGESLEMRAERAVTYFREYDLALYREKLDEMLN